MCYCNPSIRAISCGPHCRPIQYATHYDGTALTNLHDRAEPLNPKIEHNFKHHPPKDGQPEKYEMIRRAAKEFAYAIHDLVPESREKSLAMTNLEQAVMWANAGIARNE